MKIAIRASMFFTVTISLAIAAGVASAHDEKPRKQHATHKAAAHDAAFGEPGVVKHVTRTVAIHMSDAMRFSPGVLVFKQGETVRLHILNDGKLPHEFVLGTRQEIDEHAEMMRKMPEMAHTDASSIRVAPGMAADIVWTFSRPGAFLYACLVPGHHEAGMQGAITVIGTARQ